MKIKTERDKRTYLIIALCAILVVMGIGYAAFSSLLTINGTANISNSWCVGFDNTMTSTMQVTKGVSTGTTPTGSMTYSGTACGSILQPNSSLNAHFYQPGDEIEYTLTITNKSTVTAAIKSILVDNESVTSNTTKKKGNITYVIEMPADTTLDVNESTTMKVIAKFQNETDVTGNVNGETQSIEVKINAEQDDGTGGMDIVPVNNKYTGPIYRYSSMEVLNGSSIIPVSGMKFVITFDGYDMPLGPYDTESECQTALQEYGYSTDMFSCQQKEVAYEGIGEYTTDASTLGKTYYLKHDVVDDIITASYVCFVYNNEEHCMKGGVEEKNLDTKIIFMENKQIMRDYQRFYHLGDKTYSAEYDGCYFDEFQASCTRDYFGINAAAEAGRITIGKDNSYCEVYNNGGFGVISKCA